MAASIISLVTSMPLVKARLGPQTLKFQTVLAAQPAVGRSVSIRKKANMLRIVRIDMIFPFQI